MLPIGMESELCGIYEKTKKLLQTGCPAGPVRILLTVVKLDK